jgi:hypothetical protein
MAAKTSSMDGNLFEAGGLAGTAGAAALRKVRSLAKAAPAGRAFAAIATLTEMSQRIEDRLEASEEALTRCDPSSAELEWARAIVLMDKMASEARGYQTEEQLEPNYLKRRKPRNDL